MLQILPRYEILVPSGNNKFEIIEFINNHIQQYSCADLSVDISNINILDSCEITTLCSTTHFIKYPDGKISWKVSSELISSLNKDLSLGNIEYFL